MNLKVTMTVTDQDATNITELTKRQHLKNEAQGVSVAASFTNFVSREVTEHGADQARISRRTLPTG
jgi:hypothetical protein